MADGTKIEWAHAGLGRGASWNPVRARNLATGAIGHYCEHASPGCVNCYSEAWNRDRLGTRLPFKPGHRKDVEVFLDEKTLLQPLHWRAPRGIFVGSMTDAFGAFVTDEMLDKIFAVAALCPQHRSLFLTKRSARMRDYFTTCPPLMRRKAVIDQMHVIVRGASITSFAAIPWPLPNVWLGVSAEDQTRADERIPDLLATPAAVRWVSAEPLLGPINFREIGGPNGNGFNAFDDGADDGVRAEPILDWIVVGGESGPHARPMHPQWARDIRDQCAAADVPFFFKQWGAWKPISEMTEQEVDAAYHPATALHPEATRRPKVAREVLHIDGTRFTDVAAPGAFLSGKQAMSIYEVGRKAAGRLLDGREHNDMPRIAA